MTKQEELPKGIGGAKFDFPTIIFMCKGIFITSILYKKITLKVSNGPKSKVL